MFGNKIVESERTPGLYTQSEPGIYYFFHLLNDFPAIQIIKGLLYCHRQQLSTLKLKTQFDLQGNYRITIL